MGKSRVAPLKPVIIPGMELSAAVLSTRLDTMFREELEFTVDESIYWTDSTCVNVSRGMTIENITDSNCWSKRPCFLWQDEENWPKRPAALDDKGEEKPCASVESKATFTSLGHPTTPDINKRLRVSPHGSS